MRKMCGLVWDQGPPSVAAAARRAPPTGSSGFLEGLGDMKMTSDSPSGRRKSQKFLETDRMPRD